MSKIYDLIVVGAGTAGMACAIEAAQRGAQVMVIEKSYKIGGAMHWSGGHMSAGGTQLQARNNIEDSVQEHYDDIIRINNGTGDVDLIKKAVEEAPHTLNWLDDLKFPWAPECPRIIYGHVPYMKARTQYGADKANSIFKTIKPLWTEQVVSEHITCLLQSSFTGLKINGDHSSIVSCEQRGQTIEIEGKNVVMTTGGYGSNADYFHQKHGDIPYSSSAYPESTGEAMIYLEQLGVPFRMADYHLPSVGGLELEPGTQRANFNDAWAMVLTSVYRRPRDIYVNQQGNRFMNEDEPNADTREREVVKQDGWKLWVLFDEDGLMAKDEHGNDNPIIIGWNTDQIKTEAQRGKAIFVDDTIEGLAMKAGLPPENVKHSISRFNGFVDEKEDPDFGRTFLEHKISKGPFYAVEVNATILVTFGGLTVNKDLQIVNHDNKPIPNLYGAGELLGLGALSGNAFCSGMAITPALSFGRILGRELTK